MIQYPSVVSASVRDSREVLIAICVGSPKPRLGRTAMTLER